MKPRYYVIVIGSLLAFLASSSFAAADSRKTAELRSSDSVGTPVIATFDRNGDVQYYQRENGHYLAMSPAQAKDSLDKTINAAKDIACSSQIKPDTVGIDYAGFSIQWSVDHLCGNKK